MSVERIPTMGDLDKFRKNNKETGKPILGEQPHPMVDFGLVEDDDVTDKKIKQGQLEPVLTPEGDSMHVLGRLVVRALPVVASALIGAVVEETAREIIKRRRRRKTPDQSATKRPEG